MPKSNQKQNQNQEPVYRSQSYWLDSVRGSLEPRPALSGSESADVVIIGAGYTGLWTAYYLKTHAPHLDVAILEADIAGFGASGRNGGWCSFFLAGMEHWLEDPATREAAIALQRDMMAAVDEVGRVSCLENIDCHFDKSGAIGAAVNPGQLKRQTDNVAWWRKFGFGEEDFRTLSTEQVHEHVRIPDAIGGVFSAHCAAIHPAGLARGLAKAVVAKGVRLYEQSPALKFDGHHVTTPEGDIRCGALLLATEGFTETIPQLKRRLMPVHSMMIATEKLTPDEIEATGLTRRFTWNNERHLTTYGQLTQDGRIAFGSRGGYYWNSGIRTSFDASEPMFKEVRGALTEIFPILEGKAITHAWGGPMGVSRNLEAAVVWDEQNRSGWAGGYFGDGVCASNLAGRTLADLVLKRDSARVSAPWVNPKGITAPPAKSWEPEPLRWLGVAARYRLLHLADNAEEQNLPSAKRWNHLLETLFP